MASVIFITGRSPTEPRHAGRGFTLVEVMVSAVLGSILMAMILGVVVTQTRLSASVGNYEEMNRQGRVVLKAFETDMRQARTLLPTESASNGYDVARVNIEVIKKLNPDATPASEKICYGYDAEKKTLWREQPSGSNRKVLLTGVTSCRFAYFGLNDNPLPNASNPTPSPREVRKIMVSASLERAAGPGKNTDNLVSAIVVLRKPLL